MAAIGQRVAGVTANTYLNSLIDSKWSWAEGESQVLKYNFNTSSGKPFDSYLMELTRKALAGISSVIDLKFVETTNAQDSQLTFQFASMWEGTVGNASMPSTGATRSTVSINPDYAGVPGNHYRTEPGFTALLLHEVGHALGLGHSCNFPGCGGDGGHTGDYGLNNFDHTVMSYNGDRRIQSFRAFDIAALQAIYGANTVNGAGDNLYRLEDLKGGNTIWDAGGKDIIAYSGSLGATIDLRPATLDRSDTGGGAFSFAGDGYKTTIADGVMIDGAYGGSGDDVLRGNDAGNTLNGRAGADVLTGGAGADTFEISDVATTNENLIRNGDFSGGWADFNVGGGYTKLPQANAPGTVAVVDAPPNVGLGITSGRGGPGDKFLMVDGSTEIHKFFWGQSAAVEVGKRYELTYWVNTNTQQDLVWRLNGSTLLNSSTVKPGTGWQKVSFQFVVPEKTDNWGSFFFHLNSMSGAANGNDFALDDFSLREVNYDTITDFSRLDGDVLSITQALGGTSYGHKNALQYLRASVQGNDTVVQIDRSGRGVFNDASTRILLKNTQLDNSGLVRLIKDEQVKVNLFVDGSFDSGKKQFESDYWLNQWQIQGMRQQALVHWVHQRAQYVGQNGDFDSEAGWLTYGGVSIDNGQVNASGSSQIVSQTGALEVGKTYTVSFDYSMQSGSKLRITNGTVNGDKTVFVSGPLSGSGTLTTTFVAKGTALSIEADSQVFVGSIDNIKAVSGQGGMGVSTGRTGDKFLMVDSSWDAKHVIWKQGVDFKAGSTYELKYYVNVNATTQLSWQIEGQSNPLEVTTVEAGEGWQEITFEFTASKDGWAPLALRSLSGNDIALDDFSLHEVKANLLIDGSFSSGLRKFDTDYAQWGQVGAQRSLAVVHWAPDWGMGISTGRGNDHFLMVDSSSDAKHIIWKQQVDLKAGTVYEMSYWVNTNSTVDLVWQINGDHVPIDTSTIEKGQGWQQVTFQFSGFYNGGHSLQLRSLNTAGVGNDIALDDFSLQEVSPNLIRNGDFNGAWGEFSTNYNRVAGLWNTNQIAVTNQGWYGNMGGIRGRAGDNFLNVALNANQNRIIWQQGVELSAGDEYELSYYVRTSGDADLTWDLFNPSWQYRELQTDTVTVDDDWQQVTVRFTAEQSGVNQLRLFGNSRENSNWNIGLALDDFSLRKINDVEETIQSIADYSDEAANGANRISFDDSLLINGDFEQNGGDLGFDSEYKWVENINKLDVASATISTDPVYGMGIRGGVDGAGDTFLVVSNSANADDYFWGQDVELEVGQRYSLSYFLNTNGNLQGDGGVQLQWSINGESSQIEQPVFTKAQPGWQEVKLNFIATEAQSRLEVRSLTTDTNGYDIAFDKLRLTQTDVSDIEPVAASYSNTTYVRTFTNYLKRYANNINDILYAGNKNKNQKVIGKLLSSTKSLAFLTSAKMRWLGQFTKIDNLSGAAIKKWTGMNSLSSISRFGDKYIGKGSRNLASFKSAVAHLRIMQKAITLYNFGKNQQSLRNGYNKITGVFGGLFGKVTTGWGVAHFSASRDPNLTLYARLASIKSTVDSMRSSYTQMYSLNPTLAKINKSWANWVTRTNSAYAKFNTVYYYQKFLKTTSSDSRAAANGLGSSINSEFNRIRSDLEGAPVANGTDLGGFITSATSFSKMLFDKIKNLMSYFNDYARVLGDFGEPWKLKQYTFYTHHYSLGLTGGKGSLSSQLNSLIIQFSDVLKDFRKQLYSTRQKILKQQARDQLIATISLVTAFVGGAGGGLSLAAAAKKSNAAGLKKLKDFDIWDLISKAIGTTKAAADVSKESLSYDKLTKLIRTTFKSKNMIFGNVSDTIGNLGYSEEIQNSFRVMFAEMYKYNTAVIDVTQGSKAYFDDSVEALMYDPVSGRTLNAEDSVDNVIIREDLSTNDAYIYYKARFATNDQMSKSLNHYGGYYWIKHSVNMA